MSKSPITYKFISLDEWHKQMWCVHHYIPSLDYKTRICMKCGKIEKQNSLNYETLDSKFRRVGSV